MPLSKFESMLKTNSVYFFDLDEFEEIIIYYLDSGKHSLAKKAVQLGLEQHPTSIDLKLLEIEILIFADKLDKASTLIKKLEELDPENEEVYIQKATIQAKKGNHKEAINTLEKALLCTDSKEDIWSLLGMEYLYIDDFVNARINFEKCVEKDFEDYSALYNIIYCFDMMEDNEGAIHYLTDYINKNPYSEVAWHQIGRQYYTLERYKEALTAFDYAVIIDESFLGAYLEKAKTLEQLDMYIQAIENYMITLELDDPTAFAYARIGDCYQELDQLDEAIKYFKKAVHEDPLLDRAWVHLTEAYVIKKDFKKSLYYINKALKIDQDNALYWRIYGEINVKLGVVSEAIVGLKKSIELHDFSIENYISLIDCLILTEDFYTALNYLFSANKLFKDFAEIEYRLAGVFFLLDKENYAKNHLVKGLQIDSGYSKILRDIFPSVYDHSTIKSLIANYLKATE